jgi:hypothetical protein
MAIPSYLKDQVEMGTVLRNEDLDDPDSVGTPPNKASLSRRPRRSSLLPELPNFRTPPTLPPRRPLPQPKPTSLAPIKVNPTQVDSDTEQRTRPSALRLSPTRAAARVTWTSTVHPHDSLALGARGGRNYG